MNISRAIKDGVAEGFKSHIQMAVVIDDSPLTIRINGETVDVPARRLDSYTPSIGHEVRCYNDGLGWIVDGRVV